MLGCSACGGVFLGAVHAQRILDAPCEETMRLARSVASGATATPDASQAALPCPVCSAPMARQRVDAAAVDVDGCAHHGTWFDRNELDAVSRAFAVRRAYGRHNAAALGGAVAAAGVAGAAVAATDPALVDQAVRAVERHGSTAVDVADVGLEVADVALDTGVLEGAVELAGGAFEVLGSILSGLGDIG